MYDLCRSREIWVFRLKNLDIDQAPCFAPYEWLGDLSTEVIRRKVIQAIRTSEKWAKPEALRVSDLATLKLTPRMLPYRISCPNRLKPEVVAGGEFVIIENQGQLELWSTLFSEKLWVSLTPGEPLFCHSFGSELQHGGEVLVIAAVYVDYLSGKRYALLLEKRDVQLIERISLARFASITFRYRHLTTGAFRVAKCPYRS